MTIEEFIVKCQKRPIPTNPMARVRLLAKELAEGASYDLWQPSMRIDNALTPMGIHRKVTKALNDLETTANTNENQSRDLHSFNDQRILSELINDKKRETQHIEFLLNYIKGELANAPTIFNSWYMANAYFCTRWWSDLPNLNLLFTTEFARQTESNYFVLLKSAFDLLAEVEEATVFISYKRSESSAFALLVNNTLKQHGIEPFVDMQLQAGDDWHAELENNIKSSDYFIILLGQETLTSEVTIQEIQWAIEGNVTLIPIWHNNFEYKSGEWHTIPVGVDYVLSGTHTIRVLEENPLTYDTALRELLNRFGISI